MKALIVATLATLCCLVSCRSITIDDCPGTKDKYLQVHGRRCYRFHVTRQEDYLDAHDACKEGGGSLVTITTKEMNDFIQKQLKNTYGLTSGTVWVGLRYHSNLGRFYWENNEPSVYKNFLSYTFQFNRKKKCVAMLPATGKWETLECQEKNKHAINKMHFVCQYVPDLSLKATIPSNCPLGVSKDKYLQVFGDKCYYFHLSKRMGYISGERFCEKDGGTLVQVKSKEINSFLQEELTETYKEFHMSVWIGLRYKAEDDAYKWMDGTRADSYMNFQKLNRHPEYDECIVMSAYTGKWSIYRCLRIVYSVYHEQKPFICEYPVVNDNSTIATLKISTAPTTITSGKKSTNCPNVVCDLDCGMSGFDTDKQSGCMLCECAYE